MSGRRARAAVGASLAVAALMLACSQRAPAPERFGSAPAFALNDELGRRVDSGTLRGTPYVVAFFFTRCPTVCPRVAAFLRSVQERAGARRLQLLSISVDPEHDGPAELTAFARKHGADPQRWRFLVGPATRSLAEDGFKVAVSGAADASKPDFGILHGTHVLLVDGAGVLRGVYRSSEASEADRLLADVDRLTP